MNLIEALKIEAKQDKKRIVLPETMDERVLKAAEQIIQEDLAEIILIGEEQILIEHDILKKATLINPKTSNLTNIYIDKMVELRKEKGLTKEQAKKLLLEDYMYFSCMLVLDHKADGIVSGAIHSSANTLRPALQLIKTKLDTKIVSSFFLMIVPNCSYGEEGVFLFADCGLIQDPTSEELAEIALASNETFQELVKKTPYIAMLSHSTKGSAHHKEVEKVIEATKIVKENNSQIYIDGELQLDAAIIPAIAEMKAPDSEVAGKANVLIFPNLDSGNIGYKLVERLAHAKAYGPLTQGMKYPVNDLSRGCSVDDIVGVIVITAVQAQKIHNN